jgi:hypothetical protein
MNSYLTMNRESDRRLPSGAKARILLLAQTARLKPCPTQSHFMKQSVNCYLGTRDCGESFEKLRRRGRQLCPEYIPTQESG